MKMRVIFGVFLSAFLLTFCGKAEEDFDLGSGGTPNQNPGNDTTTVTVPAGTFSLQLTSPIFATHLLHKAGSDFEAPCAVDPTATGAARFIECYVEVDELDLIMHGLSFTTTISSENCQHVSYTPYYYLSAPAGTGPTAVSITVNKDSGVDTQDPNGFSVNSDPYCPYDYSYIDGGPNCCTGKYALTKTTTENTITKTQTTDEEWGGEVGNCLSGAGTLDPKTSDGWPKTIYTINTSQPGTGLSISKSYKGIFGGFEARTIVPRTASNDIVVTADHPVSSGFSFLSAFYANYYDSTVWGTAPDALAHPYYQFTCLDSAHEETGRIRLVVREWNIRDSISPTNLAAADTAGLDTNGMPNNDMGDWDDMFGVVNPAPAPYSTPPVPADYLDIREGYPYFHITAQ